MDFLNLIVDDVDEYSITVLPRGLHRPTDCTSGTRNFFPINAPGMGRFQLLNWGVLGYGLELRFWVVIPIIVSLTLTITLITILTII